jgi:hypothetical protein
MALEDTCYCAVPQPPRSRFKEVSCCLNDEDASGAAGRLFVIVLK